MQQIIFINRYFYPDLSATSQMLGDLVFGLNKSNCEIHIVTSRQRYDDANAVLASLETINGIVVHRVWTTRFGRQALLGRAADYFTFYLSAAVSLLKITRAGAIIVAKTDPPLISIVAAVVAAIKSARLINWLQDLFPEVAAELGIKVIRGPVYTLLKNLRNFTLKRAEKNIVLGDLMAQRLEREGIPADKIAIISNWADGRQIQPVPHSDNPLRAAWDLEQKFVVGYSGNLGRSHDFLTILEAARKLSDDTDIVFLFIGAGAQLGSVREQTQALSLSNIEFRPYQPRSELANSLSVPDVHLIS
ncbi:MAG: glycosyltransferase family 4 protein, partial [Gammaproteobacteria bacterium]|nr:glycosyltransferase family 4 protein [Gammaproteobacteria bacterium]